MEGSRSWVKGSGVEDLGYKVSAVTKPAGQKRGGGKGLRFTVWGFVG